MWGDADTQGYMIEKIRKRLSCLTTRNLLLAGTFLGVGALPCPDCGAPMIFHIWPIAGLLVIAQFVRKRNNKERGSEDPRILPPPLGTQLEKEDLQ
jgi:hypothetical protein